MPAVAGSSTDRLIVLAGYNGLGTAQDWARQLAIHAPQLCAAVYSWRQARQAADSIAAMPGRRVTLIGHSLGGGQAQRIVRRLPAGTIDRLITVAPFAPRDLETALVRQKVGSWLNIVCARRWHDPLLNLTARIALGWRDQGAIADASENYVSRHPHQDFYRMVSERCGAAANAEPWLAGV